MNKVIKYNLIIMVCFFLSLSLVFSHIISLNADSAPLFASFERIVFDASVPYLYLDSPTSLDVCAEGITIADNDGSISVFNTYTLEKMSQYSSSDAESRAVLFDDTVIYTENGNIVFENEQKRQTLKKSLDSPLIDGYDFVSLDKDSGVLYAVSTGELVALDALSLMAGGASEVSETDFLTLKILLPSVLLDGISAFCVGDGMAYFASTASSNKNFDDIYSLNLETDVFEKIYQRTSKTNGIVLGENELFLLSGGEIVGFEIIDGRLSRKNSFDADATAISLHDDLIFALTNENALISVDIDLGKSAPVFLSQSEQNGFFSAPASVFARRGNLFVADTFNDRLYVSGSGNSKLCDGFERISSVVSDNVGNVFVSYGVNKIARLDGNSLAVLDVFNVPRAIKKLIIDTNNNILVLTVQGLYVLTPSYEVASVSTYPPFVDACFVMGSQTLIYYDGISVFKTANPLDSDAEHTKLFERTDIACIASDLEGNVFFTETDGGLFRFDASSGAITSIPLDDGSKAELKLASSIIISSVDNDLVGYGDLIFASMNRHCIYRLDGAIVGAVITDGNHESPNISERVSILVSKPIIFRLKAAAELFQNPIEVGGGQILARGSRIIYYDEYNSLEEFAFVIFEDTFTKKLSSGYIFRNLIDFAHYEFSSPPSSSVVVYFDNTPVYKFPSVHAAILEYYDKDTDVVLTDFAAPIADSLEYSQGVYIDGYGRSWYRIALASGGSGFIQADYLSINKYVPAVRPSANATIIAFGEKEHADLYYFDQTDQTYKLLTDELPLAAGTRVEITTTPLNPQNEFTEIRFYRENLGTLTCYVKTNHLQYDTITSIQILAIIALAIIVMVAVIVVIWLVKSKQRR